MSAPPNPRLAAQLTKHILDNNFVEDISLDQFQGYIWFMQVLLNGGWVQPDKQIAKLIELADSVGLHEALKPWTVQDEYSEVDVTAHLVSLELFGSDPR